MAASESSQKLPQEDKRPFCLSSKQLFLEFVGVSAFFTTEIVYNDILLEGVISICLIAI